MGREEGGRDGEKRRSSMWMIEMKECERERKGGGRKEKEIKKWDWKEDGGEKWKRSRVGGIVIERKKAGWEGL